MDTRVVRATITRPANTTAYTAGDVMAGDTVVAPIEFGGLPAYQGEGALIESALVVLDQASSGDVPDLELWLFEESHVLEADNAVWAPSAAEMLTCVGKIVFPEASFQDAGSGHQACFVPTPGITFDVQTLYGVMVVRNAYVPTSGEVITVLLGAIR